MTCFVVEGKLRGKGRPRFLKRSGTVYTPKETVQYEKLIRDEYIAAGGRMLDGAVKVEIRVFHSIPKSVSKKKRLALQSSNEPRMKKPDIDNIVKVVLDALNGIAYADDTQVVGINAMKLALYSDTVPRLEIEIGNLESFESSSFYFP